MGKNPTFAKRIPFPLTIFFIFGALAGCGAEGVTARIPGFEPAPASSSTTVSDDARLPPVAARLRNTHYYTLFESDYAGASETPVRSPRGTVIATVPAKFYKDLLTEGSGKLKNGKVLNFSERIDGDSRYEFSPHPWGNGVGSCALVPYHTIAVDKSVIPLGSTVYIDETKGMKLPDGSIHDGIWRADDVGSMIQKDRVDLFVGKKSWNKALRKFHIRHLQALTVRILKLPDGESCAHH